MKTQHYTMSFTRAKAVSKIEDNLQPVSELLAKIFTYNSVNLDREWSNYISHYLILVIRYANNVSSRSRSLDKATLIEKLDDCFMVAECSVPITLWSPRLRRVKKASVDTDKALGVATEYLLPELIALSPKIASLILENNILLRRDIAKLLADATKRIRNEYLIK